MHNQVVTQVLEGAKKLVQPYSPKMKELSFHGSKLGLKILKLQNIKTEYTT
jgi:hypothetical protein